jgi:hypothetical protein
MSIVYKMKEKRNPKPMPPINTPIIMPVAETSVMLPWVSTLTFFFCGVHSLFFIPLRENGYAAQIFRPNETKKPFLLGATQNPYPYTLFRKKTYTHI